MQRTRLEKATLVPRSYQGAVKDAAIQALPAQNVAPAFIPCAANDLSGRRALVNIRPAA
jgi:hypothetical protein